MVALAAAALLLFRLGEKSLWLDEAFSVDHARPALGEVLSRAAAFEANQTLYYIILHYWLALGEREFTLRLLSAIFALATVPLIHRLATKLFGPWPGVVAAAAMTVNAFFIHFGQEARGYSLALLLVTLQTLLFVRGLETRRWAAWAVYAATGAGACYAQIFAMIVPAVHLCAALLRPPKPVPWRRFLASLAGMGLGASPLALFVVFRNRGQLAWLASPGFGDLVVALRSLTGHTEAVGAVAVIAVALLGFVAAHRCASPATGWRRWGARLALLWFFGPAALCYAISQFKPMFLDRYLLVTLPGLILLIAAASMARPRWLATAAIVVAFAYCARGLVFWFNEYKKEDWRAATRLVLERSRPGDGIAFVAFSVRVPFEYYVRQFGGLPPGVAIVELASRPYFFGGVMPPPDRALIRRLDDEHPRVWLLQSHASRIPGRPSIALAVRAELFKDFFEERRTEMPGVAASRFRRRAAADRAPPPGD